MSRPTVRGKTVKTVIVNLDEREVAALENICALGLDQADAIRAALLRAAGLAFNGGEYEAIQLRRHSKKGITLDEAKFLLVGERDDAQLAAFMIEFDEGQGQ